MTTMRRLDEQPARWRRRRLSDERSREAHAAARRARQLSRAMISALREIVRVQPR